MKKINITDFDVMEGDHFEYDLEACTRLRLRLFASSPVVVHALDTKTSFSMQICHGQYLQEDLELSGFDRLLLTSEVSQTFHLSLLTRRGRRLMEVPDPVSAVEAIVDPFTLRRDPALQKIFHRMDQLEQQNALLSGRVQRRGALINQDEFGQGYMSDDPELSDYREGNEDHGHDTPGASGMDQEDPQSGSLPDSRDRRDQDTGKATPPIPDGGNEDA